LNSGYWILSPEERRYYFAIAISDKPIPQIKLPAQAHVLRNWCWIRVPAMTGAMIWAAGQLAV